VRLIHTADWHLGRKLKGVDRTPEIAAALDDLLAQAKALSVDAVLMAGDIFDVPNPPAEAERVAYKFFSELQQAKIPAVLIAGNHDSALRIDGLANLLSLAGVEARGKPRRARDGGMVALETANGKLRVGTMPFASERRLLSTDDLWNKDDIEQRQQYRTAVSYLLQDLAREFRNDSVNVMTLHLSIDGAKLSNSEVAFYTRDTYALSEHTLPAEAQYIALGHIHTYQRIPAATPAYYSGSLIQVDFGEAGQTKGFCLVNVEPGRPAQVEFRPLVCTRPLHTLECTEIDLTDRLEAYRDHPGYLKVIVHVQTPPIGLADRVRKICPQAIQIEPRYPNVTAEVETWVDAGELPRVESFARYYQKQTGTNASQAVLEMFEKLYREMGNATS
jgi:exonuclease SbcD